ncbi:16S rRNA methyltransferase [Stenotrophomonas ginsengisoli]|uniref:16S rRNA methyltransferase n=1 Tax=Stenotrophomonas ginsengisoli TaxID=336566 RepID=A0A0R0D101_9GAMM|nr:class I SAM-dependent methyltransferase [Stenotrophomonas ginsengisoli]KRG75067.1 16S rRNA methyltransferase [Stenotrophomonas ginsengisoli]
MSNVAHAPLKTLTLPFARGELAWPASGKVACLRARAGLELPDGVSPASIAAEQSYFPQMQALRLAGWDVSDTLDGRDGQFDLVLVLSPRQKDEARAVFARALALCAPGGRIVACQHNDEGARSGEADLKALAGLGGSLTKNHCRVFWTLPLGGQHDAALASRWLAAEAPRSIAGGRFTSRPGVFAWDRIDPASALLVEHLPSTLAGIGADLGAGWGYLSAEVLERCAKVTRIDLYEAEGRALALARHNLAAAGERATFHWADVSAGLAGKYDFVVTNPPFHTTNRTGRPELGQSFIKAAADGLRQGGRLLLVANRHLPYEEVLGERFSQIDVLAERDGFKLISAIKAGR